jgi:hypothetical protein
MKTGCRIRPVHLAACAFCLLVLLSVGMVLWPQPRVSYLAISFTAFTNTTGQPRAAMFSVTNLSRRLITFGVPDPQVRKEGAWPATVATGPLLPTLLKGGGRTVVTAAVPTGGEAWRLPILWVYEPSETEFYVHRRMSLLGWKHGFRLTGHTNFSAAMEPSQAEPDGARAESKSGMME